MVLCGSSMAQVKSYRGTAWPDSFETRPLRLRNDPNRSNEVPMPSGKTRNHPSPQSDGSHLLRDIPGNDVVIPVGFDSDEGLPDERSPTRQTVQLVRLMIAAEAQNVPLKRATLTSKLGLARGEIDDIIVAARKVLQDVFGYDLVEYPEPRSHRKTQRATSKQVAISKRTYGLCNRLPDELRPYTNLSGTHSGTRKIHGLLCFVLTLVFTNGREADEQFLYRHLKRLGFDRTAEHHALHITFQQLLAKFVRQGYLIRQKLSATTNEGLPNFEYTWGGRAELEFGEKGVQRFIGQFYEEDVTEFVSRAAGEKEDEGASQGAVGEPHNQEDSDIEMLN